MPNFMDKNGALALQERIISYWEKRGYSVSVDIVPTEYDAKVRAVRYDVRSQMVNGVPKRRLF